MLCSAVRLLQIEERLKQLKSFPVSVNTSGYYFTFVCLYTRLIVQPNTSGVGKLKKKSKKKKNWKKWTIGVSYVIVMGIYGEP